MQSAKRLVVAPEREVGLRPRLERRETNVLESPRDRLRGEVVGQLVQRPAAPERERLVRGGACTLGRVLREEPPGVRHKTLGLEGVHRHGVGPEDVTAVAALDGCGVDARFAQRSPEPRHLDVETVRYAIGRVLAPKGLDQPVASDHLPGVQGQQRQQCARLGTAKLDPLAGDLELNRPKDPDLHQHTAWWREPTSRTQSERGFRGR